MGSVALVAFSLFSVYAIFCAAGPNGHGFISQYTVNGHTDANYFFAFGDSYSRVMFDVALDPPSAANPIGNPAFPGTTTSGTLNWVEVMITQHNKTLNLVYDFAYGGATVDETIIPPPGNSVDFNEQTRSFQNHMMKSRALRWGGSNSFFSVWFGQNDVYQAVRRGEKDPSTTYGKVTDVMFERVEDLYQAGARNFLFIGVAPLERTPLVLTFKKWKQDKIATQCRMFNDNVSSRAAAFARSRGDVRWRYYDPAPAFNRVLDNPKAYGAPDSTCHKPDGTTCLWWNDYHPGLAIHEQVAADVAGFDEFHSFFNPAS